MVRSADFDDNCVCEDCYVVQKLNWIDNMFLYSLNLIPNDFYPILIIHLKKTLFKN